MTTYIGDFVLGSTFDVKFTTVNTSGVPTALSGGPVISAYPGNSTTEITAGITLTTGFDALSGFHNIRVVATSGNGYATATNYALIITTGTVGGSSVVGYVIAHFSIENRPPTSLSTQAKADVNAEVLDVLSTDTFGEPTGVPGATITLREKIGWVFMALRNALTVTATKMQFLDDGGAAEWEKDLSDDGSQYSESEANAP